MEGRNLPTTAEEPQHNSMVLLASQPQPTIQNIQMLSSSAIGLPLQQQLQLNRQLKPTAVHQSSQQLPTSSHQSVRLEQLQQHSEFPIQQQALVGPQQPVLNLAGSRISQKPAVITAQQHQQPIQLISQHHHLQQQQLGQPVKYIQLAGGPLGKSSIGSTIQARPAPIPGKHILLPAGQPRGQLVSKLLPNTQVTYQQQPAAQPILIHRAQENVTLKSVGAAKKPSILRSKTIPITGGSEIIGLEKNSSSINHGALTGTYGISTSVPIRSDPTSLGPKSSQASPPATQMTSIPLASIQREKGIAAVTSVGDLSTNVLSLLSSHQAGEASVPIQLMTDKSAPEHQSDLSNAARTVKTSQSASSKAEGAPLTGNLLTSLSAEDIIQVPGLDVIPLNLDSSQILWSEDVDGSYMIPESETLVASSGEAEEGVGEPSEASATIGGLRSVLLDDDTSHRQLQAVPRSPNITSAHRPFRQTVREKRKLLLSKPTGPGPITCPLCSKKFSAKSQYKEHVREHMLEREYPCTRCDSSFNKINNLELHMIVHLIGSSEANVLGDKSLDCPQCGIDLRKLSRVSKILQHLSTHKVPDDLVCPSCELEFPNQDTLDDHITLKHTVSISKQHKTLQATENVSKSYICEKCSMKCSSRTQLREHMETHKTIKSTMKLLKKRTKPKDIVTKKNLKFQCKICKKMLQSKSKLDRHQRTHTGEKPFKCHFCDKGFSQKSTLDTHLLVHEGKKPHLCPLCNNRFTQRSHLRLHMKRVHDISTSGFQCVFCSCTFKKVNHLHTHVTRFHPDQKKRIQDNYEDTMRKFEEKSKATIVADNQTSLQQDNPEPALPSQNRSRRRKSNDKDLLTRAIEDAVNSPQTQGNSVNKRKFVVLGERSADGRVKKHIVRRVTLDGVEKYLCSWCSLTTKKPSDLIRHFRKHTKEKPYRCPLCSRCFSFKSALTTHFRIHKKPFLRCEVCDKPFVSITDLKAHKKQYFHYSVDIVEDENCVPLILTKDGIAPVPEVKENVYNPKGKEALRRKHECEICSAKFKKMAHLKAHKLTHTKEKSFTCDVCQAQFQTQSNLNYHMKMHYGDQHHECHICGKVYKWSQSLQYHIRTHKQDQNEYYCPLQGCEQSFKSKTSCKRHIKKHKAVVLTSEHGEEIGAVKEFLRDEGELPELSNLEGQAQEEDEGQLIHIPDPNPGHRQDEEPSTDYLLPRVDESQLDATQHANILNIEAAADDISNVGQETASRKQEEDTESTDLTDAPNQVLMDSMGTVLTTFDMVTDAEGGLRLVQSFAAADGDAGEGAGGHPRAGVEDIDTVTNEGQNNDDNNIPHNHGMESGSNIPVVIVSVPMEITPLSILTSSSNSIAKSSLPPSSINVPNLLQSTSNVAESHVLGSSMMSTSISNSGLIQTSSNFSTPLSLTASPRGRGPFMLQTSTPSVSEHLSQPPLVESRLASTLQNDDPNARCSLDHEEHHHQEQQSIIAPRMIHLPNTADMLPSPGEDEDDLHRANSPMVDDTSPPHSPIPEYGVDVKTIKIPANSSILDNLFAHEDNNDGTEKENEVIERISLGDNFPSSTSGSNTKFRCGVCSFESASVPIVLEHLKTHQEFELETINNESDTNGGKRGLVLPIRIEQFPNTSIELVQEENEPATSGRPDQNPDFPPSSSLVTVAEFSQQVLEAAAALKKNSSLSSNPSDGASKKQAKCEVCGDVFLNTAELTSHKKMHMAPPTPQYSTHKCTTCKAEFRTQSGFVRHQNVHVKSNYHCGHINCNMVFKNLAQLTNHNRISHEGEPGQFIDFHTRRRLASQIKLTDEETADLLHRAADTNTRNSLSEKILIQAIEEKLESPVKAKDPLKEKRSKVSECPICGKQFKKKNDLDRHARVHTGERPYSCHLCEKTFGFHSSLKNHLKTHTGGRSFHCHVCKSLFASKASLKMHMRIHAGSNPYKCPLCEQSFRTPAARKIHVSRTHGGIVGQPSGANTQDTEKLPANLGQDIGEDDVVPMIISAESLTAALNSISQDSGHLQSGLIGATLQLQLHGGDQEAFSGEGSSSMVTALVQLTVDHKILDQLHRKQNINILLKKKDLAQGKTIILDDDMLMSTPQNSAEQQQSEHQLINQLSSQQSDIGQIPMIEDNQLMGGIRDENQLIGRLFNSESMLVGQQPVAAAESSHIIGPLSDSSATGQLISQPSDDRAGQLISQLSVGDNQLIVQQHSGAADQLTTRQQQPDGVSLFGSLSASGIQQFASLDNQIGDKSKPTKQQTFLLLQHGSDIGMFPEETGGVGLTASQDNNINLIQFAHQQKRNDETDKTANLPTLQPDANVTQEEEPKSPVQYPIKTEAYLDEPILQQEVDPNPEIVSTEVYKYICPLCAIVFSSEQERIAHLWAAHAVTVTEDIVGTAAVAAKDKIPPTQMYINQEVNEPKDDNAVTFNRNLQGVGQPGMSVDITKKVVAATTAVGSGHNSKANKSASKAKARMKDDTTPGKHICPHCFKSFTKPSLLKRHEVIHTGERAFPCHICNKSFSQKTSLVIHLRIHEGSKPYTCEYCHHAFSQKSNLNNHIIRFHRQLVPP